MNKKTYLRLKNNPHYKPSDKELEQMEQIEYGEVPFHVNKIPKHKVRLKRKKRRKIDETQEK